MVTIAISECSIGINGTISVKCAHKEVIVLLVLILIMKFAKKWNWFGKFLHYITCSPKESSAVNGYRQNQILNYFGWTIPLSLELCSIHSICNLRNTVTYFKNTGNIYNVHFIWHLLIKIRYALLPFHCHFSLFSTKLFKVLIALC